MSRIVNPITVSLNVEVSPDMMTDPGMMALQFSRTAVQRFLTDRSERIRILQLAIDEEKYEAGLDREIQEELTKQD